MHARYAPQPPPSRSPSSSWRPAAALPAVSSALARAARIAWALALAAVPALAAGAAAESAPAFPLHALLRGAVPPPAEGAALRLVHMTDTHVVADGTILQGVDTAANLRVAIAAVNALKPRPHLVAVTGDLTLDSADGLFFAKSLLSRLEVPWFPVPGNHDKALRGKACEAMFQSLGFPRWYAFDYAGRHFVCLDADEHDGTTSRGRISEEQLAWLRKDLREHRDLETLVFLHHHPLLDDWDVPNRFAQNAPLLRAIRENPQVKWTFSGHSHDNRFLQLEGTRCVTTAATSYAFGKPPLPFGQHGSGVRVVDFAAGGVSSFFLALSGEAFPDPPPEGYLSASRDPATWAKAFGPDTAAYKAPPAGPHVLVALCQVPCRDGALEENLAEVASAAREAKAKGAAIACFPESMDFGWVNVEAHRLAPPLPGPVSDRVTELALTLGLTIAIGLTEKVEGGIADSAIIAGPDGSILLKHRKINTLPELMDPPYVPGRKEDIRVADTPLGRLGLLVCADTFVDEHLEILRALEPDLVLVPYGWAAPPAEWPGHGEELKKTVCRAAKVIGAPVIGPTTIGEITSGPWKGRTYEGESAAADAEGNLLFFGLTGRREVAVFPVPLRKEATADPLAGRKRIFDFREGVAGFAAIDDVVMGGRSSSAFAAAGEGVAAFAGTVSLEGGGGFASVRSAPGSWDLGGHRGIALRVRGDGKAYKLSLRTDARLDGVAYQAGFSPRPGVWETIRLPFSDFVPRYRGREVPGADPLDPAKIATFGLLIAEKQAGPFRLEVAWIEAWR